MIPVFRILDVIRLSRQPSRLSTVNKSCCVLSCRIRGEARFTHNGVEDCVSTGDVLYIPYGASYTQQTEGEEIVCFHLETYSDLYSGLRLCRHERRDEVIAAFLAASDAWERREEGYEYRCTALLYEILHLCGIELLQATPAQGVLSQAMNYLEAHVYDTDFSISALCAYINISRGYFHALFREAYSCKPWAYVTRLRISKACALLRSGNYTNEEVARLSGFGDVKYFYTVFKRQMGKTTGHYLDGE